MAKQLITPPGEDLKAFIEQLTRLLNENFDHLDGQGAFNVRLFKALEERVLELEELVSADTVPEHDHSGEDEGDTVVQPIQDHVDDASAAHAASAVSVLDVAAQLAATDVEAALAEILDALQAHEADAADAHDASAISIADAALDFDATNVEAALAELQADAEADSAELTAHQAAENPHGAELDDLTDVSAAAPVDGDVLTWDSVGAVWQPEAAGGGAHPDLAAHDTLGLATQAELDAHAADNTVHEAFPVGSVFIAVVATNPGTLLGYGTWAAFAAGRMLVGINGADADFDTVEEVGGAKTHQHASGGAHTHDAHGTAANTAVQGGATRLTSPVTHTSDGGHQHDSLSHLPPYIVVYMWKRTA